MTGGRRLRAGLMVSLALGWGFSMLATASTAANPKPDLKVTSARLVTRYVFRNQPNTVVWKDTTKNVGSAPAGRSVSGIEIGSFKRTRKVPALAVGEAHPRTNSAESDFPSAAPGGWVYWSYCPAAVIADARRQVAESNEKNNVKATSPECLDVIPRALEGTVRGTANEAGGMAGWTETVEGEVRFAFDHYSGSEGYVYKIESGSLTFTASGSNGYCTLSGSGTVPESSIVLGETRLQLIYDEPASYYANARIATDWSYPMTCTYSGGFSQQMTGPISGLSTYIATSGVTPRIPGFEEGAFTALFGTYSENDTTWEWNLTASDT